MKKAENSTTNPDKPGEVSHKPIDVRPLPLRLTRERVAARLGVSIRTVRRMESRRELVPIVVNRGGMEVHVFNQGEVEAIALTRAPTPRSAGEVASMVFQLLDAGKEKRDIVVLLKQPPKVVNDLYEEWLTSLEETRVEREHERGLKQAQAIADAARAVGEKELAEFEREGRKRRKKGG